MLHCRLPLSTVWTFTTKHAVDQLISTQGDTTYDSCPAHTRPLLQSGFRLRLNSRLVSEVGIHQRNCPHSPRPSSHETRSRRLHQRGPYPISGRAPIIAVSTHQLNKGLDAAIHPTPSSQRIPITYLTLSFNIKPFRILKDHSDHFHDQKVVRGDKWMRLVIRNPPPPQHCGAAKASRSTLAAPFPTHPNSIN